MRRRLEKSYIAAVRDADGVTNDDVYVSTARSRRDAEDEARESARRWGGTLLRSHRWSTMAVEREVTDWWLSPVPLSRCRELRSP